LILCAARQHPSRLQHVTLQAKAQQHLALKLLIV
jgi:hypothetical protein